MKIAQVVHFRVKPGNWDNVLNLVARWQQDHSADQDGIADTFIWKELRDPNQGTALVLCESEEALESFSTSPITQQFFEAAKEFLEGDPDYFHAELTSADMLKVRSIH